MSSSLKESAKQIEYIRTQVIDTELYDRIKSSLDTIDNVDGNLVFDGKLMPVILVKDSSHEINLFKSVSASALGSTTVWVCPLHKHIRVMRIRLDISGEATIAAAGHQHIHFLEDNTDLGIDAVFKLPAAARADNEFIYWDFSPNGIRLSHEHDLNIDLDTALTAGELRVNVMGWEES